MNNIRKELGKISSVKFGKCGYQESCFGLELGFTMNGYGVGTTITNSWDLSLKPYKNGKWNEIHRQNGYAKNHERN